MKTINIYNYFKAHIALGVVMAFTVVFTGCEQFDLNEDPSVSELSVAPYGTIEEMELGVTGIYNQLNRAAWMTTFYVNGWSGDDMTTHRASNKADFREYDQRAITTDNSRTSINWAGVYEMIRAANTVLKSADGVTLTEVNEQNVLIGETHFLRALMFYHLARIHGRIAIILDVNPEATPVLATQVEVYEQIESDLLMAESLLPEATGVGAARPSAGSAKAILARLYLDWAGFPVKDNAKYGSAATKAKEVIDNAAHGFSLVPNMEDLYTVENRFNSESIFTIAYCSSCGLPNRKHGKLGLPGDFNGWQETFAEIRFFEDFPAGPRKDATYHAQVPVNADGNITNDIANAANFVPWTEFKDQQNPLFKKIVGPITDNIFGGFESDRNDFYMRYAEVLLIYAEASGEAGTAGADAWDALNEVRDRAGLPDVSAVDGAIEDLAYTERKWELAGEYLRWNDLVRKEQVDAALGGTARNPQVSIGTLFDADGNGTPLPLTGPSNAILGSTGTDNYFAPIPQGEIEKLPSLGN